MLEAALPLGNTTRLLRLLQAALPFLTPSWHRLADRCIRFLSISEFISECNKSNVSELLHDIRGCAPANDINALLGAIRPFCLEEELSMLRMYEQFQQLQKTMELWKMFSDLMPEDGTAADMFSAFSNKAGNAFTQEAASKSDAQSTPKPDGAPNPLLSFLSPEQLALYNSILSAE